MKVRDLLKHFKKQGLLATAANKAIMRDLLKAVADVKELPEGKFVVLK